MAGNVTSISRAKGTSVDQEVSSVERPRAVKPGDNITPGPDVEPLRPALQIDGEPLTGVDWLALVAVVLVTAVWLGGLLWLVM